MPVLLLLAPAWQRQGLAPFTTAAARVMGLDWDGVLRPGCPADLVVLEQGRIKASGPVAELLQQTEHPALGFAETATLLLGDVDQLDPAWHLARVAFAGGAVWVRDTGLALGRPVRLRILARDVSLASAEPQHSSIQNQLPCVIEAIVPDSHASQRLVRLRCGSTLLQARVTARAIDALGLRPSSSVWAQVKSVALVE